MSLGSVAPVHSTISRQVDRDEGSHDAPVEGLVVDEVTDGELRSNSIGQDGATNATSDATDALATLADATLSREEETDVDVETLDDDAAHPILPVPEVTSMDVDESATEAAEVLTQVSTAIITHASTSTNKSHSSSDRVFSSQPLNSTVLPIRPSVLSFGTAESFPSPPPAISITPSKRRSDEDINVSHSHPFDRQTTLNALKGNRIVRPPTPPRSRSPTNKRVKRELSPSDNAKQNEDDGGDDDADKDEDKPTPYARRSSQALSKEDETTDQSGIEETTYDTPSKSVKKCAYCGSKSTPMWRRGPHGAGTLCNACGVKWKHGKILQGVGSAGQGPNADRHNKSASKGKGTKTKVERKVKKTSGKDKQHYASVDGHPIGKRKEVSKRPRGSSNASLDTLSDDGDDSVSKLMHVMGGIGIQNNGRAVAAPLKKRFEMHDRYKFDPNLKPLATLPAAGPTVPIEALTFGSRGAHFSTPNCRLVVDTKRNCLVVGLHKRGYGDTEIVIRREVVEGISKDRHEDGNGQACTITLTIGQLPIDLEEHATNLKVKTKTCLTNDIKRKPLEQIGNVNRQTELIPYINSLKVATLFAPTNEAFKAAKDPITRDILLYHMLPVEYKSDDFEDRMVLETALIKDGYLGSPSSNESASEAEPRLGQRARVDREGNKRKGRGRTYVGGAQIINKDQKASNGMIHVVDQIMRPPADLLSTLPSYPQHSLFMSFLERANLTHLFAAYPPADNMTRPYTIFAPHSNGFSKRFNAIEMAYLGSDAGVRDLEKVLKHHIAEGVWFAGESPMPTLSAHSLNVEISPEYYMTVDSHQLEEEQTDILAANGAIQSLPTLLLPDDLLQWTVRMYLHGLNATMFVQLCDDNGLGEYLDAPIRGNESDTTQYTFLVPRNEALEVEELPYPHSPAMKAFLQYHIVQGRNPRKSIRDGDLWKTVLAGDSLKGQSQRVRVSLDRDSSPLPSSWKGKDVMFNDAGVVGDPVELDFHVVYTLSQVLRPPGDLLETLVKNLTLSTFVATTYAAGLQTKLKRTAGTTVFVPTNDAFTRLGLIGQYLISQSADARRDLQKVLLYHVVDEVIYDTELKGGIHRTFKTLLDGEQLQVWNDEPTDQKGRTSMLRIQGSQQGGDQNIFDGESQVYGNVIQSDLLLSTGSAQIVDRVQLPPRLNLTAQHLLKGIHANTFMNILRLTNLTHLLTSRSDYTILAPTDRAFSKFNLTTLYDDREKLAKIAMMHIIPKGIFDSSDKNSDATDRSSLPTLLTNPEKRTDLLQLLNWDDSPTNQAIQVKGHGDDENGHALVLGFGKVSCDVGQCGGGVLSINRVLIPRGYADGQVGGVPWWGWMLIVVGIIGFTVGLGWYGYLWYQRRGQGYIPLSESSQ
ncbi:hypothetical protein BZG36_01133 [Bifiguratus adelaidae]|uniref:FAS1 domain-containing protein n=1 Tax=Bifiguratus adelaidae TaxID=1938954 RepID=A0A261Y6H4_9FUNG|nr:hypothetical protein BZG36_01133 [Bifiguratus adelaidae]